MMLRETIKSNQAGAITAPPRMPYTWTHINWKLPDAAIARQLGCACQTVCQKRRKLNKPRSPFHRCSARVALALRGKQKDRIIQRALAGESLESLALGLGISLGTLYRCWLQETTPEQRRTARSQKMSAAQHLNPHGFHLVMKAGRTVWKAECQACGASLMRSCKKCSFCGTGSVVPMAGVKQELVRKTKAKEPGTARERIAAFLAELGRVA